MKNINIKNLIPLRFQRHKTDEKKKSSGEVSTMRSYGQRTLTYMQKIGKSLVFPIAILPAAAILLRIGALIMGYGDVNGSGLDQFTYWVGYIIITPGDVVFGNLAAIFAIGVGFGFSKDKRGEAALVAFVFYVAFNTMVSTEGSLSTLVYSSVLVDSLSGNSSLLYLNIDNNGALVSSTWMLNLGVFGGILSGLITAWAYNKWSDKQLPKALGFFSGRRFVPMVALLLSIPWAFAFAVIWPWIQYALVEMSFAMSSMPVLSGGVFVFVQRLLIPFGLHQILNTIFHYQLPVEGSSQIITQGVIDATQGLTLGTAAYTTALDSYLVGAGAILVNGTAGDPLATYSVNGDIYAFLAGVQGAGIYQVGLFPVMLFGLPAIGLAIAHKADGEYRSAVLAYVITAAAISFFTGITEPLEFMFAFVSPGLYFVYALLSGFVAMATVATGALSGYGFSAGFIDLMISIPISMQLSHGASAALNGFMGTIWIVIIGVIAAPIYYLLGIGVISKFDLPTPGRRGNLAGITQDVLGDDEDISTSDPGGKKNPNAKWARMAASTLNLVGRSNIVEVDNCITRLRLTVKDNSMIDKNDAVALGYIGYVKGGKTQAHFILGAEVEIIAKELNKILAVPPTEFELKNSVEFKNDNINVVTQENVASTKV